jgi:cell division septal protein FtsQ
MSFIFIRIPERKSEPKEFERTRIGFIPFVLIVIGIIVLVAGGGGIGLAIMAVGVFWIIIVVSSNAKNTKEVVEFNMRDDMYDILR